MPRASTQLSEAAPDGKRERLLDPAQCTNWFQSTVTRWDKVSLLVLCAAVIVCQEGKMRLIRLSDLVLRYTRQGNSEYNGGEGKVSSFDIAWRTNMIALCLVHGGSRLDSVLHRDPWPNDASLRMYARITLTTVVRLSEYAFDVPVLWHLPFILL